jgi:hypothetical protein
LFWGQFLGPHEPGARFHANNELTKGGQETGSPWKKGTWSPFSTDGVEKRRNAVTLAAVWVFVNRNGWA